MIISEALGTSTPTSMTVVATSRSISPCLNARIAACFSAGFMRPWTRPTRSSGNCAESASKVACAALASSRLPAPPCADFSLSSASSIKVQTQ